MNAPYASADTLRNGDLSMIADLLKAQRTRALDVVVPASELAVVRGQLIVAATGEPVITEDGVTQTEGAYDVTSAAEAQMADRLGIPLTYMRRMRGNALDLWDGNVNGWLHGDQVGAFGRLNSDTLIDRPGDPRKFLLRLLRGDDTGAGVVRAVLSDSYKIVDNLDVLMAVLAGVQASGAEIAIEGADLTDKRMNVRISAPAIRAMAPQLLAGYRSPFDNGAVRIGNGGWTVESARAAAAAEGKGYEPGSEPVVFAGFVVSNSETGHGSFSITPRLVVEICRNGLTIGADALRSIHLGGKLDEGVVKWSTDTQDKQLALITAQARDAVASFLDAGYVAQTVAKLEEMAGAPVADAPKVIELVAKKLAFTEAEQNAILNHFITGGQLTAGGIMQAVSSAAQTITDGEAAAALEAQAVPAMALAAAAA
jgi:hypothetical protein